MTNHIAFMLQCTVVFVKVMTFTAPFSWYLWFCTRICITNQGTKTTNSTTKKTMCNGIDTLQYIHILCKILNMSSTLNMTFKWTSSCTSLFSNHSYYYYREMYDLKFDSSVNVISLSSPHISFLAGICCAESGLGPTQQSLANQHSLWKSVYLNLLPNQISNELPFISCN